MHLGTEQVRQSEFVCPEKMLAFRSGSLLICVSLFVRACVCGCLCGCVCLKCDRAVGRMEGRG